MDEERYRHLKEKYGSFADVIKLAEDNEYWSFIEEEDCLFPENPECGCRTHQGPHWLHQDKLWHERNLKLLEGKTELGLFAFAKEESERLKEKLLHLGA